MIDLNKQIWTKKDGEDFNRLLLSMARADKIEWTRRIVNTSMPLLALRAEEITALSKQIKAGNVLSFLDLDLCEYHENTMLNAKLISSLKDFDEFEKYLYMLIAHIDNWATCDTLSFGIWEKNKPKFLVLQQKLACDPRTFARRISVDMLFPLVDEENIAYILNFVESLSEEKEYYVNMAAAWLICDCFIKRRAETLLCFESGRLNDFIVNKAVQKCRDSFRVSNADKDLLLKYRVPHTRLFAP